VAKTSLTKRRAKQGQPSWLQQQATLASLPKVPEHVAASTPPRLLSKSDVLKIANVTFPTI
jgi:hypothetical protein